LEFANAKMAVALAKLFSVPLTIAWIAPIVSGGIEVNCFSHMHGFNV
jgi:hypothetical protein